ncbi:MAG TPA: hypothetical protein VMT55_00740, partial [Candidatus Sulfotelmatobacter sp.]|nr:hypothetical protein [Candidatus Sulfotelmatobacter sp.]
MGGDMQTSSGGIHPGKPIIWPTGKSQSTPVSSSPTTQSSGSVRSSQSSATSSSSAASASTAVSTPAKAASTPAAQSAATISRPLTIEDLRSHLMQIQIPDTDFNVKLASMMLKDGMEL